jgi:TonB-linked SusC/RagA family outer membrane protein
MFKIKRKTVVITTVLLLFTKYAFCDNNVQKPDARPFQSQQSDKKTIKGTVTDANGDAIIGANVVVKESSSTGTITNLNGAFSLDVPTNSTLVVSYIGYITQEVPVGNQSVLNILLKEDSKAIEEVVVVGYGRMQKVDLTGAVVSANIDAFKESPNINIMQSLQGAVPGVQIGQVNKAGEESSVSIRGTNTLNGSTDPLIVLDGIIFRGNINDLNPSDIKSVDILKDASSMAIYGAQAANGVILITTQGGRTEQKPIINFSTSYSSQSPSNNGRLLNRDEFLSKINDILYEKAFLAPNYTEPNPNWSYNQSELTQASIEGIDNGTYFDWWDNATNRGYISNTTLSISGGNEVTSYYLSGGYTDQKGLMMNDRYKRSTIRINIQTEITKWLKIGTNTFGSFGDYSGNSPNVGNLNALTPLVKSKDENGEFIINPARTGTVNPFLNAQADDSDLQNNISGNFFAIVSVPKIDGLSYRLNYNNNLRWTNHDYSNPYDNGLIGRAFKENSMTHDMMLDNIFTYEKKINDHKIQATFVAGLNKVKYKFTQAVGSNYPNLDLSYNSLQQAIVQNINSSAWEESYLYQMGRLAYGYKNRYLLTTTVRRDGFSGFSKNNKIALFPSVGIGWTLSEEPFFKAPKVDYLKIRASYGQNGNQTSRYKSLAKVSSEDGSKYVFGDGASTSIGQTPISLANNDLTWETTTGFNLGVDFKLFNNRISGNVEYYRSTTTDLLWDISLPQITGFSKISTNLGKLANTGIEFYISTIPIKAGDFQWNFDVNFSTNKNEIKELIGLDNDGDGKEDDLVASNLFIGKSIGAIYGYEIDGIWQLNDDLPNGYYVGSYKIVDQNKDGIISAADDRVILGKTEPAYRFGIQNALSYKNFTFRFFINSVQGGKNGYLKSNDMGRTSTGNYQNQTWFTHFNDYWTPSNPDARYCQPWVMSAINPNRLQSRNFVRLQDISLSYQLKSDWIKKLGFTDAKIYISGKNLLTFTNWDGWDPETGQTMNTNDNYPVMKSYTLGLNVSF